MFPAGSADLLEQHGQDHISVRAVNPLRATKEAARRALLALIAYWQSKDRDRHLVRAIALIDRAVKGLLERICRHPRFLRLEAAWQSLHYLVTHCGNRLAPSRCGSGLKVKVRILDLTRDKLINDLTDPVVEGLVYRELVERQLGALGGEPLGLCLADYECADLDWNATWLRVFEALGGMGKDGFFPILIPAEPRLLDVASIIQLEPVSGNGRDFAAAIEPQLWSKLRADEVSQFLFAALPKAVLRPGEPFVPASTSYARIRRPTLWMSAIYPIAAAIMDRFRGTGWFLAWART